MIFFLKCKSIAILIKPKIKTKSTTKNCTRHRYFVNLKKKNKIEIKVRARKFQPQCKYFI